MYMLIFILDCLNMLDTIGIIVFHKFLKLIMLLVKYNKQLVDE